MVPAPARPDTRPQPVSGQVPGVRPGVRVTVRAPATSANLGPGFDSLGLALALHDEVDIEATAGAGVEVVVDGEGAGDVPGDERHLVVRAIRAGLEHAGAGHPGLRLRCRNAIPHGRGLGSSASAVVAGLVGARALLTDPAALDDVSLLRLATAFEGHPDNAAAALLGGFTVSWTDAVAGLLDHPCPPSTVAGRAVMDSASAGVGRASAGAARAPATVGARAVQLPVHPDIWVVACVPDGELATSVARGMLPPHVPHADAAFNAARAALLVAAMTRHPELLAAGTADRLHQGQRAAAMPGSAELVRTLRARGAAAVISGAGPTVVVLGAGDSERHAVTQLVGREQGWRVLPLAIDTAGTVAVTESADRG